jgi:mycothiol system anti-sigma-R factor
MECREVTARLWEYLDGELAAKEAAAVDHHLADCPACRPRYCCDRGLLLAVARALAAPSPVPSGLRQAVRERLATPRW